MAKAQHSKGSARTRTSAKAPSPPATEGLWTRHRRDVWALTLGVVGIFVALAEVGALGPVGHALETGLELAFGEARWFLPVALLGLAAAIMWGGLRTEGLRFGLGLGLAMVSLCGLFDMAGANPPLSSSASVMGGAGGWVGTLVGGGLRRLIGPVGTVVVLLALLVVSFIFLTGIGLRALVTGVARALRATASWITRPWNDRARSAPEPELVESVDQAPRRRLDPELAVQAVAVDELAANEDDHDEPEIENEPVVLAPRRTVRPAPAVASHWELPSLDLLQRVKEQRLDRDAVDAAGEELIDALSAHGVETTLVGYTVGPTVTRFELELGAGVKVASVTSLHRDIAYAMASPDVRILAPIPGRSAIGVEVPNRHRTLVALGDLLAAEESLDATHPLDVPLGRDISGKAVIINLAEMPHVLISGATGAGKSSCINSLITSLVMRSTPDDVRMILIDPKRVELGQYNDLPHLLSPVVVDPKKAAGALAWAVKEMERRYDLLAEHHVRDLASYQAMVADGTWSAPATVKDQVADVLEREAGLVTERDEPASPERLPYIVIVVDELNDLMMVAAREVEDSVVRIAQMARAVGIHLVLATQRPSVDVITGVIKANIPSRMAFAVSSLADSRVILDQAGAERLIGKGDVLLLTSSSNVARRLQAPWVSEEEVRRVVAHWRAQGGVRETVVAIDEPITSIGPSGSLADEDDEAVLAQARELVISTQSGSTSMLQRKLRVGFARAGRLMDMLENEGVVGPSEGSKSRKVYVTPEDWEHRKSS